MRQKRLDNFHHIVFSRQVESIIRIPHGEMQRGVASRIDGVGIGALVEQQLCDLRVTHGAGDNQGRVTIPRFRPDFIWVCAGVDQNAGGVRITLLGGKHQRRESGF